MKNSKDFQIWYKSENSHIASSRKDFHIELSNDRFEVGEIRKTVAEKSNKDDFCMW